MTSAIFNKLTAKDFANGAVQDEIYAALREREKLIQFVDSISQLPLGCRALGEAIGAAAVGFCGHAPEANREPVGDTDTLEELVDFVYAHIQEAQFPTGKQTTGEVLADCIDEIQRVMEGRMTPRPNYKCPHCGWLYSQSPSLHGTVPRHQFGGAVCPGSDQVARSTADNRRLWKDSQRKESDAH
jgi:hypothetical protein